MDSNKSLKIKKKYRVIVVVLIVAVILILLWYVGAQPKVQKINDEPVLLRTAQAVSFTVKSPQVWVQYFTSLDANDPSVIPQGTDADKPYMLLYPSDDSVPQTKIIFSVNNLSTLNITYADYVGVIEDSFSKFNELNGVKDFTLLNKSSGDGWNYYEYSYITANQKIYEIKKFMNKGDFALTVVATIGQNSTKKQLPIVYAILSTILWK